MKTERVPSLSALDLLEQALFLLRHAPIAAWLPYCLGVFPFALFFLFFWADMSRNSMASEHASAYALGLALLFVWMKSGQALFAARLNATLLDHPYRRWRVTELLQLALQQAAWQTTALVTLPLALLLTLPYGWTYAFYQNMTVLAGLETDRLPQTQAALKMARLWPRQNHGILLLLLLISLAVWINIVCLLIWGPHLLKSVTGIETAFSRSSYSYLNSTFLMVGLTLSALVLNPLIKAVYLLRCFYGRSIPTGMDLRIRLSPKAALVLFLLAVSLGAARQAHADRLASKTSVSVRQMNTALDQVTQQPCYRWRMPRQADQSVQQMHWLSDFYNWLHRWWARWFKDSGHKAPNDSHSGLISSSWTDGLIYITAGLALLLLIYAIFRYARFHTSNASHIQSDPAAAQVPDLNQENLSADQLPRERWLALVDQLLTEGQFRLALRACFLARLAQLADQGVIVLARFKTNRDYELDLARYAHVHAQRWHDFQADRCHFEAVWYGHRPVEPSFIRDFCARIQRIQEAGR